MKKIVLYVRHLCSNATRLVPVLAAALVVASLLISCGGSPDDHTGANWILIIILVLCWLKG